jgi:hypothetical protein
MSNTLAANFCSVTGISLGRTVGPVLRECLFSLVSGWRGSEGLIARTNVAAGRDLLLHDLNRLGASRFGGAAGLFGGQDTLVGSHEAQFVG